MQGNTAAPGTLFQKPYLEAAKAYQLAEGGIGNAKIPERIRILLQTMAEKDKGVFTKPYSHQIESSNHSGTAMMS